MGTPKRRRVVLSGSPEIIVQALALECQGQRSLRAGKLWCRRQLSLIPSWPRCPVTQRWGTVHTGPRATTAAPWAGRVDPRPSPSPAPTPLGYDPSGPQALLGPSPHPVRARRDPPRPPSTAGEPPHQKEKGKEFFLERGGRQVTKPSHQPPNISRPPATLWFKSPQCPSGN